MRSSGQLFFYKDILHTKKPIKYTSNFYSDIFIRLKAYKAHKQLLLRYYAKKHKKTRNFLLRYFHTFKKDA